MTHGPYASTAWEYRRAGWQGVLPLPPKAKEYPPAGFTGHKGVWPFSSEIQDWIESRTNGNICLRLPENGLGIDVDAYGGKRGAENLAKLEAKYGKLPKTIVSTSRDDGISRIKLYWVPVRPGWRGAANTNSEIIQFSHRYIIVWPSIHPETGRVYRWIDERTGEILDHLPRLEDLAELPQAWVDFLSSDTPGPDKADVTAQEAHDWFTGLSGGTRCTPVAEKLTEFYQALKSGSRHNAGLDCAMGLTRFGALGHRDVRNAVIEARNAFLKAVMADGEGKRVKREAEAEWARMVAGAYSVIKADPTKRWRKCLCLSDRSRLRVTVKSVRVRDRVRVVVS